MNKAPIIYLAGPITGTSYGESTSWRADVSRSLDGFTTLSPLRAKTYLRGEQVVKDSYEDILFSSQRGIFARDMFDVRRSDALFVNLLGATRVSIGTVMEVTLAWELKKPVVIVMEKDNVHQHAMLRESTAWVVETLDEGLEVLRFVFAV